MRTKRRQENGQEGPSRDDKKSQDYPIIEDLNREERRLRGTWQVREPGLRYSDKAHGFWKRVYGESLSPEDSREITENLVELFRLLGQPTEGNGQ